MLSKAKMRVITFINTVATDLLSSNIFNNGSMIIMQHIRSNAAFTKAENLGGPTLIATNAKIRGNIQ